MKPLTYLLIDLACISVPFLFSFHKKFPFYKEWKSFFPANIIVAVFFLIWDFIFTEQGVWGFNPDYLTGLYIANLPIEEVLFFICIPYACVFTYYALKSLLNRSPLGKVQLHISILLLGLCLFCVIFFNDKSYTFTTAIFLFLLLLFLSYKKTDLSYTYLAYFLILPFFFLSNGILTGSFLDSPIVWYNDQENLGLRMFSIPVEDTFYGFLLIAMNIQLYEFFKRKKT